MQECDPAGWAATELAAAGVAEALLHAGVRPKDQASLLALSSLALRAPERRSTRERVLQSFGDRWGRAGKRAGLPHLQPSPAFLVKRRGVCSSI